MTTDATDQTVLGLVASELVRLGAESDQVTPEAALTDLDIDSLDLAELAQIVEERYAVKLTGGDVTRIKTVSDIVALIESRV